jgi:alpha-glucosidase
MTEIFRHQRLLVILSIFLGLLSAVTKAQKYEISSADKNIGILVEVDNSITYSVIYKGKTLIPPSEINLFFQPDIYAGKKPVVKSVSKQSINTTIIPVIKEKRSAIPDVYNELSIRFKNHLYLEFRAYNDGVAYRFGTLTDGEITITHEEASFNFRPGTIVFYPEVTKRQDADIFHTSFEEPYSKAILDTLTSMFAFSPVLFQAEDLPKVLITESDVNDYPGMFLTKVAGSGVKGAFAPFPLKEIISGGGFRQKLVTERASYIAKTNGNRNYPWRILAIAPSDADLLLNDIVYRLAPDAGFSDFSWIKPGKSTEEWITGSNLYGVDFEAGLNTQTYKYYIDFAVKFGFQYVMLDAGWSDVNDLFKITPGMDMDEITGYAKEKGIGLILWTQALTIESQMEKALEQFKKWDIKIVMTDFIDRNDQIAINFLYRFASECARNKFMCMIHGAPIPAGFSRTFPNMLARESVLGSEYNAWSAKANPEHDLMLPFIRMVAGPMDYEPGLLQNASKEQNVKMGFEKVIAQGTTMHQIAMFEIYESPLQLFSGNLSDAMREPELMGLLGEIPTTWDETIILKAQLGKYVVEARRNGNNWYIAGINDWTPQTFTVSLGFLKDGLYQIESAADGINATRNPQDYKLNRFSVTRNDSLTIKLAPGGGFISRIIKN